MKTTEAMHNHHTPADKDVPIGVHSNSSDTAIHLCFNWTIKMMADGGSQVTRWSKRLHINKQGQEAGMIDLWKSTAMKQSLWQAAQF